MKKRLVKSIRLSRGKVNALMCPTAVCAAAILVYTRTISYGFVFDDIPNILNNQVILSFRLSQLVQQFAQPWRSVTFISYGLTRYIFGFNPAVFHLTNVLIHTVNSLLVFGIARLAAKRWLRPEKAEFFAAAAGMVFAVHPLQSEAVAYVWGRSSSLCALFYFASLLMILIAFSKPERKRILWFGFAVVAAFLAWKAKEEAITLPLAVAGIIALIGAWRAAACVAVLPFLYVTANWQSLLRFRELVAGNRELVSAGLSAALDPLTYFLTSLKGISFYYLRLYIVPAGQCADPYLKPVSGFHDPLLWVAVVALAGLVACGFVMRFDRLFLFGLMLLLISPLTSYAVVPLADVVAEHRIYISSLGFALIAAWALAKLPRFRYAVLAGIVTILGFTTLIRSEAWADSLALWKDAEAKSPELARPHLNLGMAYQAAGFEDLAMAEYRHALDVNPRMAPAYINMAGIFYNHNDLENAEILLRKAMEIAPTLPAPYINLAQIAMKREKPQEALEILNGESAPATSHLLHFTKGDAYAQLGRYAEAIEEYEEAVRLRPDLQAMVALLRERIDRLHKLDKIH